MAHDGHGTKYASNPFEGPEKLLEIWFAPSAADVPDALSAVDARYGLRKVNREIWEEMLDIVKCKVLSVIQGEEIDAYLLSESSFFVSPHRLILKTCGTTLNLLGLPRILEIARDHASLPSVYRCFYSRKSFMFPERQHGPHKEWKDEVKFLDQIFKNGSAYTIGKVNGDHWLLYITNPGDCAETSPNSPVTPSFIPNKKEGADCVADEKLNNPEERKPQDYTIEILMSQLSPEAAAPFFSIESDPNISPVLCSNKGLALSSTIGISDLFPSQLTTLDAYSFTPCGYSANALLKWGETAHDETLLHDVPQQARGEGYYTIHVTPEEGWSYASFECNVPLRARSSCQPEDIPDLKTLIRRVVKIFQPGRLTLTLFISCDNNNNAEDEAGDTPVDAAQRAFKAALTAPQLGPPKSSAVTTTSLGRSADSKGSRRVYKRTDKINYEFGGYDLAFASFELR